MALLSRTLTLSLSPSSSFAHARPSPPHIHLPLHSVFNVATCFQTPSLVPVILSFDKPLTYSDISNLLTKYTTQWLSDANVLSKWRFHGSCLHLRSSCSFALSFPWFLSTASIQELKTGKWKKRKNRLIWFSVSAEFCYCSRFWGIFFSRARSFFLLHSLFNRLPDKSKRWGDEITKKK